jgi:hypothetical protein
VEGKRPATSRAYALDHCERLRIGSCNASLATDRACRTVSVRCIIRAAMKPLFVALFTLLACGCADIEYTAYSGRQQNWPVASGSFVSQKYGLPVYFGPPDRPYRVLGYMETQSAPLAVWETGKSESIKPAVKEAMKHGADALVLLASGTNVAGSTTLGSAQWRSNTTTTGGVYGNYFNAQSQTTGGGFGSSTTFPIRKGYARVIAIQFL